MHYDVHADLDDDLSGCDGCGRVFSDHDVSANAGSNPESEEGEVNLSDNTATLLLVLMILVFFFLDHLIEVWRDKRPKKGE